MERQNQNRPVRRFHLRMTGDTQRIKGFVNDLANMGLVNLSYDEFGFSLLSLTSKGIYVLNKIKKLDAFMPLAKL
jgi:hypothetical protein